MNTIYDRSIWKKRALRGYNPTHVKEQINDLREDYEAKKNILEQELEGLTKENKRLRDKIDHLKSNLDEDSTVSKDKEVLTHLKDKLMKKYIEEIQQFLEVKKETKLKKEELREKILVKEEERNQLVDQLKSGLQHLHKQKE